MPIQDLTLLRRRIGDNPNTETESFELGDSQVGIQLAYDNPTILNMYDTAKQTTPLVLDTDYSINGSSIVLLYTPADGSVLTVSYTHSAFSDTELNELIEEYGVNTATVEAVRWLMADSAKLHSYSRGATSESLDQVFKQLKDLLAEYSKYGVLVDENQSDVVILKRTNQWYRGKRNIPTDLSRDDI